MTASPYHVSSRIALLGIAFIWMVAETSQTLAHDSWINRGGYRNSAGEWCCGDNDCQWTDQIAVTGKGWVVGGPSLFRLRRRRRVRTGRFGSVAGPTTRAVACSRHHPARDMEAVRLRRLARIPSRNGNHDRRGILPRSHARRNTEASCFREIPMPERRAC
jgi:hypothetical protein